MSNERRTHNDRLAKLRLAFGRRQEIARLSGKKHDVSIAKICAEAKVDKVYLFGYRLQESDGFYIEYKKLKAEILAFQDSLSAGLEKTADKKLAEESEKKYRALLSDVEPIQRELALLKSTSHFDRDRLNENQNRITELLAHIANLESKISSLPKSNNVEGGLATRIQKHVVSPDKFRSIKGDSKFGKDQIEAQAWAVAYQRLEELLARNLKMRLYILVGLPCSGKSTWAERGEVSTDRHPVIWDDCNITFKDRLQIISTLHRFKDIPKTCVFFDTDMEKIRERNRTLHALDKVLSDEELSQLRDDLQRPDPYEEKWIDEFIIVR